MVSRLLEWYPKNARDLPWRRTTDPYAIWVSEIMLQQTQVKTVIPYWERWMQAFPNVAALAAADQARVLKLWEGLGYYTRARNLHRAAQLLAAVPGGVFPVTLEAVLELPGVGRYTAGAVMSIAFNQPTPILDGNVIRVLARLHGITANVKERAVNERLWALATQLVARAAVLQTGSERNCSHLNQALMELGATVCTPRQPACLSCPVREECVAFTRGVAEQLPNLGKRAEATKRRFVAFVVEANGRYLVRQRPAGVVNAHLWEFPNFEVTDDSTAADRGLVELIGPGSGTIEPLCQIQHSITRYRITLEARLLQLPRKPRVGKGSGVWLQLEELDALAFTAAHKKILGTLAERTE
jgi:A/G-specific adenine glycosylase